MALPSQLSTAEHPRGRWVWLREKALSSRVLLSIAVMALMLALLWWWRPILLMPGTQPLVMHGGDPYLRALMRTISASESNVLRPYHVIYGSSFVWTLDDHPNRCESIGRGPNKGNCSTAAGRYQLLNSTWSAMSLRYHPHHSEGDAEGTRYSFEPIYQDTVVYEWLDDEKAWRTDLSAALQAGRVNAVLRRLSGTWTSLGYGIENNRMSKELPRVYKQMLEDELSKTGLVEPTVEADQTSPTKK